MSSAPATGPEPACLTLWDEEDFQGRRCRLLRDCANIREHGGLRRVRSVKDEYTEGEDLTICADLGTILNHSDSRVTLFEGDNFQGCNAELSDDYPSLPSMGWTSKDVGFLKVSSGGWVAYQYPGYQYMLEQERHGGDFHTYSKFGMQAHSGQLKSIWRVQQ